jgi:hypothetical protein
MTDALTIRKMGKPLGAAPRSLHPCGQKDLLCPIRQIWPWLFTRRDRPRLTLILRGGCPGLAPADFHPPPHSHDRDAHRTARPGRTSGIAGDRPAVMTQRRAGPDDATAEPKYRFIRADRGLATCRRDAAGEQHRR